MDVRRGLYALRTALKLESYVYLGASLFALTETLLSKAVDLSTVILAMR